MNSSELALYLEAGFIDFNIETDERFLPKILTNNQQEQVKVLENLLFELEHCDEFFFSVAFVTNSGIACLIDTLKELENMHIKGKILASQYQNFTEPRALRRLLQFPNLELKIIISDYTCNFWVLLYCNRGQKPSGKSFKPHNPRTCKHI